MKSYASNYAWKSLLICRWDAGWFWKGAIYGWEISTGLDSSTTFQIVNSLKQYIHVLKGTTFASLLQPAPEIYDLFDNPILLSDGQIVYQGPCEHVLD